jgi:hypothetical protein
MFVPIIFPALSKFTVSLKDLVMETVMLKIIKKIEIAIKISRFQAA